MTMREEEWTREFARLPGQSRRAASAPCLCPMRTEGQVRKRPNPPRQWGRQAAPPPRWEYANGKKCKCQLYGYDISCVYGAVPYNSAWLLRPSNHWSCSHEAQHGPSTARVNDRCQIFGAIPISRIGARAHCPRAAGLLTIYEIRSGLFHRGIIQRKADLAQRVERLTRGVGIAEEFFCPGFGGSRLSSAAAPARPLVAPACATESA